MIDNLSDAEFKTLVTGCSQKWQYSLKTKEEMKATQSEIKKNIQGTHSEGEETWTQINNLEQKEEVYIQSE